MKNLEDEALHQLNKEMNDLGQRTLKVSTTDTPVITEGARSIAFDTMACSENTVDDLGGLFVEDTPFTWIENVECNIYGRERDSVSVGENFQVIEEKDIPVADSIVDESRGSEDKGGLDPDDSPIDMSKLFDAVAEEVVVDDESGDSS